MNEMQGTQEMPQALPTYLLAIRGTLAPATLDAARTVHNETAGAPANMAAAQSLGDLSHMVHVPTGPAGEGAGEFLILDVWNNIGGLQQFFANEHVQEQAGRIFSARDPVVWIPAEGFFGYHLSAPYGKNDRVVAVVRGTVRSRDEARQVHNGIIQAHVNAARRAGALSHDAYVRPGPPDDPTATEFLAVDVWMGTGGMGQFYQDPAFIRSFQELFTAQPDVSTWVHPPGDWVEW